jgi:TP901 family phage tail tape measure protein
LSQLTLKIEADVSALKQLQESVKGLTDQITSASALLANAVRVSGNEAATAARTAQVEVTQATDAMTQSVLASAERRASGVAASAKAEAKAATEAADEQLRTQANLNAKLEAIAKQRADILNARNSVLGRTGANVYNSLEGADQRQQVELAALEAGEQAKIRVQMQALDVMAQQERWGAEKRLQAQVEALDVLAQQERWSEDKRIQAQVQALDLLAQQERWGAEKRLQAQLEALDVIAQNERWSVEKRIAAQNEAIDVMAQQERWGAEKRLQAQLEALDVIAQNERWSAEKRVSAQNQAIDLIAQQERWGAEKRLQAQTEALDLLAQRDRWSEEKRIKAQVEAVDLMAQQERWGAEKRLEAQAQALDMLAQRERWSDEKRLAAQKQALDLMLQNERWAAEKMADADAFRNASFATSSPRSRLRTAESAGLAMAGGVSEEAAIARYGSAAVAAAANVHQLRIELEQEAAAQAKGTAATVEHTEALRLQRVQAAEVSTQMAGLNKGLSSGFGGGVGMLTQTAGMAAGFGLASALVQAVKAGSEFEYQMKFVQVISEATGETMESAGRRVLEMSSSMMASSLDLATAMRTLAQAGLSAQDSLRALPAAMNFAQVGETDAKTGTNLLLGSMTAFKETAADLPHIGDVFAKAGKLARQTPEAIGESMKQASSIASRFNISMEETGAVLVELGRKNIGGSAAGTAIRAMMEDLMGRTSAARKAIQALGVEMYDSEGRFRSIVSIIEEMKAKLSTQTQQGQNNFINEIAGQRGGKVLLTLLEGAKGELQGINEQLLHASDNLGFMQRAASELKDTTKGQLSEAMNTLQADLISAFQSNSGGMHDLAVYLKQTFASAEFRNGVNSTASSVAHLVEELIKAGPAVEAVAKAYIALKAGMLAGDVAGAAVTGFMNLRKALDFVRIGFVSLATAEEVEAATLAAATGGLSLLVGALVAAGVAWWAFADDGKQSVSGTAAAFKGLEDTVYLAADNVQAKLATTMEKAKPHYDSLGHLQQDFDARRVDSRNKDYEHQQQLNSMEFTALRTHLNDALRAYQQSSGDKETALAAFIDNVKKIYAEWGRVENEQFDQMVIKAATSYAQAERVTEDSLRKQESGWKTFELGVKGVLDRIALHTAGVTSAIANAWNKVFDPANGVGPGHGKSEVGDSSWLGGVINDQRMKERREREQNDARAAAAKSEELLKQPLDMSLNGKMAQANVAGDLDYRISQLKGYSDEISKKLLSTLQSDREKFVTAVHEAEKLQAAADGDAKATAVGTQQYGTETHQPADKEAAAAAQRLWVDRVSNARDAYKNETTLAESAARDQQKIADELNKAKLLEDGEYLAQTDAIQSRRIAADIAAERKLISALEALRATARDKEAQDEINRVEKDARTRVEVEQSNAQRLKDQRAIDNFIGADKKIGSAVESGEKEIRALKEKTEALELTRKSTKNAAIDNLQLELSEEGVAERLKAATAAMDSWRRAGAVGKSPVQLLTEQTESANRELDELYLNLSRVQAAELRAKGDTAAEKSAQKRATFGMSKLDADKSNATFKVDQQYNPAIAAAEQHLNDLKAKGLSLSKAQDALDALKVNRATAEKQAVDEVAASYDQEHSVMEQMQRATQQYQDQHENAAKAVAGVWTSAMDGLTNSLTRMVMGQKAQWKELGASILEMLAKIAIEKAIAGIAGGITMGASSLFTAAVGTKHSGGIVGVSDNPSKSVSSSLFSGAPRFHTGGIVGDEVPIIAKQGEGVFTKEQMRSLAPVDGSGGANQNNVQITINVGGSNGASSSSDSSGGSGLGDVNNSQWTKLANSVKQLVQQQLNTEMKPGGLLNKR